MVCRRGEWNTMFGEEDGARERASEEGGSERKGKGGGEKEIVIDGVVAGVSELS